MFVNMTQQSTNEIYAFYHGSWSIGQIRQISYICLLEKNFGKPRRAIIRIPKGYITRHYLLEPLMRFNSHGFNWKIMRNLRTLRLMLSGPCILHAENQVFRKFSFGW